MQSSGAILLLALSASLAQAAVLPRLRVSENGRFFIKEGGAPFLYLGDTEWTLLQCTRDDVDTYLADRAAKKFTVIQISVAGFDALKKMFVDGDPARPNEEYFRFLDYVVRKAESLGLYVALAPNAANRAHHFEPQLRPGGRRLGPRSGQAGSGWRRRLRRDRRRPGAWADDYHSRRAPHRVLRDICRGGGLHVWRPRRVGLPESICRGTAAGNKEAGGRW